MALTDSKETSQSEMREDNRRSILARSVLVMKNAPDPIRRLVHALTRLPGIGEKSAQRLSFFIVNADDYVATDLADALVDVRHNVGLCQICQDDSDPHLSDLRRHSTR